MVTPPVDGKPLRILPALAAASTRTRHGCSASSRDRSLPSSWQRPPRPPAALPEYRDRVLEGGFAEVIAFRTAERALPGVAGERSNLAAIVRRSPAPKTWTTRAQMRSRPFPSIPSGIRALWRGSIRRPYHPVAPGPTPRYFEALWQERPTSKQHSRTHAGTTTRPSVAGSSRKDAMRDENPVRARTTSGEAWSRPHKQGRRTSSRSQRRWLLPNRNESGVGEHGRRILKASRRRGFPLRSLFAACTVGATTPFEEASLGVCTR